MMKKIWKNEKKKMSLRHGGTAQATARATARALTAMSMT